MINQNYILGALGKNLRNKVSGEGKKDKNSSRFKLNVLTVALSPFFDKDKSGLLYICVCVYVYIHVYIYMCVCVFWGMFLEMQI